VEEGRLEQLAWQRHRERQRRPLVTASPSKGSASNPSSSEPIPGGRLADARREWWDGEGQIFLIWGILNPNGPTLYALGSREFDGKQGVNRMHGRPF
jgi:hypothetical protein